jgi:hypothetical protein
MQQADAESPKQGDGRHWPKGTSGNPTGIRISRHALKMYHEIAAEFGGEAALSAIDRALLLQSCRLMVRSARLKKHDAAIRMASEARRGLEGIGRRTPRRNGAEPSLSEYLKQDAERQAAGDVGRVDGAAGAPDGPQANKRTGDAPIENAGRRPKGDS